MSVMSVVEILHRLKNCVIASRERLSLEAFKLRFDIARVIVRILDSYRTKAHSYSG